MSEIFNVFLVTGYVLAAVALIFSGALMVFGVGEWIGEKVEVCRARAKRFDGPF